MKLMSRLEGAWRALRADSPTTTFPPDSDFWYSTPGLATASGQRVNSETAMRIAAVYACVRRIGETISSFPLIIYKRLPNGGKERATSHPLYNLLRFQPNYWQTPVEFIEMLQGHYELRGNAYAKIVEGPNSPIEQLIPLHPDRVSVYVIAQDRLKYKVQDYFTGQQEWFNQEEILHIRGFSSNGWTGLSTISVAAEALGSALAQQEFAARFFENDSKPSGVLEHPAQLSEEGIKRLKASWQEAQTGTNRHKVAVLENDMKYHQIGISNADSQFIEARQFSRSEIASIFGVPPHKIGDLSRATFSNIEQQAIEFLTDSIRPRLVRWEQRINADLINSLGIGAPDEYFCEFLIDALLRGDQESRYTSYATGRQWGWLSVNDIRGMENMNPIEGGDQYLRPMNMVDATDPNNQEIGNNAPPSTTKPSRGKQAALPEAIQ